MKVRNLYTGSALVAAALCSVPVNAQESVYIDEAQNTIVLNCDNTGHFYSNWRNNWFIQLGAGVNQPFVERGIGIDQDIKSVDRQRMTAVYNFGFGRWMSPYLGFRINAIGGALHWNNPTAAQPLNGWTKGKHANVNFELMWDMFNSLGGVNANRVFSIIPFAGFGGDYMWRIHDSNGNFAAGTNVVGDKGTKDESWTLPVSAGIQFRFRLCKYVDFFAEARATFYGDNWNLCAYGDPVDVNVAALGGFNINIGGRGWDTFEECYYLQQISALNADINDTRAELLAAQQALAACEAQLPCPEVQPVIQKDCVNAPMMTSVRFTINSAKIMADQEVNIYNMVTWLKQNPNEKICIIGYADANTGLSDYNQQLSERRAQAVADALVQQGIDRSRFIKVDGKGSSVQPYDKKGQNDWNRIVIFSQNCDK